MRRIPGSTYRIQFNKDFGFKSAEKILEYLHDLGITDIYASPIWHARKGSMHGYDIVEPAEINPELGSDDDFRDFRRALKYYNFGWLQDIVPNHMAFSGDNQMLVDLLENGENSRYFNFFDIDWRHPHTSMKGRLLAPFLGKLYEEALESGEIKLSYSRSGFSLTYYETCLPVKMESYPQILSYGGNNLISTLGRQDPDVIKYLGVVYSLRSLPSAEEIDERYYQIMFVKEILWELYTSNEIIKTCVDQTIEALNGRAGDHSSFDNLDSILRTQNFRLSFWKVAVEEINYRRFFNISELICLRAEDEDVFKRTHSLINKLTAENEITGLRVDHVDGLFNPSAYLKRLREQSPNAYIVTEKILGPEEDLPDTWPVEGTTGYEYINFLNGLFIKQENERKITAAYQKFTKHMLSAAQTAHDKKRLIIRARMAGDVERLAYLIENISSKDRYGIDITLHGLKGALEEILTYFPVYRTYINRNEYSGQDRKYIDKVIELVNREKPGFKNEINYIGRILKMDLWDSVSEQQRERALDFVMRFQQLTGPIMAKGVEDTALYVYNRFVSLNEVGSDPGSFGTGIKKYHRFIEKKAAQWPHSMNASTTHDTKRGEDTRARINVLSEFPDEWEAKLKLWNSMNKKYKRVLNKLRAPDRNDEYFLYQNMIGTFPFGENELESFRERLSSYILKAAREAKVHTAWINPNESYESSYKEFVNAILKPGNEFLADFTEFQKKISFYGVYNSLAQTIIKLTSPGVPDIYQGSEMWNFSLVDPDNRRPVDYELRKKILGEIKSADDKTDVKKILSDPASGKIKMYIVRKLLCERNNHPGLFSSGSYNPLFAEGYLKDNIIAFSREAENEYSITITARFFADLYDYPSGEMKDKWQDTKIEIGNGGKFKDILTGNDIELKGELLISDVFRNFPFAVLIKQD